MWVIITDHNYEDLKWLSGHDPGYKLFEYLRENDLQRWVNEIFSEYIISCCLQRDEIKEGYGIHRLSLDNLSKSYSNNILNIYKNGKYITRYYAKWVLDYRQEFWTD
jgi:hypothetical protein